MKSVIYTIGELKRRINESAKVINTFEPVLGNNMRRKDMDSLHQGKRLDTLSSKSKDGKISNQGSYVNGEHSMSDTLNKTNADLKYDSPVSQSYSDKVLANLEGYTTADEKKRREGEVDKDGYYGNGYYKKDNDAYIQKTKEKARKNKESRTDMTMAGLTGRMLDRNKVDALRSTAFNESKTPRFTFKRTQFINEGHMRTLIPENVKKDGCRFIMKDSVNDTYLLEWAGSDAQVIKHEFKQMFNEETDRIKNLMGFKDTYNNTSTVAVKKTADTEFKNVFDTIRNIK